MKTTLSIIILVLVIILISILGSFKETLDEGNAIKTKELISEDDFYYSVNAKVSAYTASVDETDDSPCYTASMTYICSEHKNIVANNCLEFGTKVIIDGTVYEVEDRMNSRYTKCGKNDVWYFDILLKRKSDAMNWGVRDLEIIIIK